MLKLKIAITGGIASGKTAVSNIIRQMGYSVYNADEIYTELLSDPEIVIECSNIVGIEPLHINSKLVFDRVKAKKIVFDNACIRDNLNSYTHKLVYQKIDEIFNSEKDDKPIFFEIPLLFESGKEGDFDRVIVVLRSVEERLKSIQKRDNRSLEESEKIIKSQFDYNKLDNAKHTIIYNDGDINSLEKKVRLVIEAL